MGSIAGLDHLAITVADIERTIADLEGATQALNNFAHSDELTTETEHGLKWLALQIDGIMVELRNGWDELHRSRPREVS